MAQQKRKEWQPFTKLIWFFFIFAIPIAIGGGWRIAAYVILGIIAASVLVGVAYGVTHRNDIRKPAASDVDKVLDDLLGDKEGSGKP
jgi:hypothetical protein